MTALSFSLVGDWITAGHSSGAIIIWDLKTNSIVRKITDAFKSSIENILFLADRQRFIATDIKGSVKILTLNRLLFRYVLDVTTLADNVEFPVVQLSALPFTKFQQVHHLCDHCLVAIASKQKVCKQYNIDLHIVVHF